MIKKLLFAVLLAVPAFGFAQKFGYIDTESLVASLPEVKEVEMQLETISRQYEADFNSLKNEMDKKYAELQRLKVGTPEEIVKRRVQEIQELDQKMNEFRQTAAADIKNYEDAMMAPIRNRISEAVRQVGVEGDYIIIFEGTAPVYVRQDVVDVTSYVREKLANMPQ